jgi:hypothetical protein
MPLSLSRRRAQASYGGFGSVVDTSEPSLPASDGVDREVVLEVKVLSVDKRRVARVRAEELFS